MLVGRSAPLSEGSALGVASAQRRRGGWEWSFRVERRSWAALHTEGRAQGAPRGLADPDTSFWQQEQVSISH